MRAITSVLLLALAAVVPARCAAAGDDAERRFEFKQDEKSLYEGLKSTNTNTKVRSAIFLWNNYKKGRGAAEDVMEHDADPDVRRRIAQVLASKQKNPKAIKVLKDSLDGIDISKQSGAMSFLISAGSLREATGEKIGVEKALKILTAPPEWFSDVNGSPTAYAQKDAPKLSAASYLAANIDSDKKAAFEAGLKAYVQEVQSKIPNSSGKERKYWEARLPTALDIALRAGMDSFVASFDGKQAMFQEAYEKERFERVMKTALQKRK